MEQACPHALTTATMKSIIGKKTHHIRLDVRKNLHMRLPNTPAMDKSIETFAAQSISSWHTSVFDPFVKSKLNELYIFSTLESTQSGLHRIIKKTVRVIINNWFIKSSLQNNSSPYFETDTVPSKLRKRCKIFQCPR